ncbi:hypothetical protein [Actinomyces lilanjuaniae]|uniref:hypothetical protein n=1 Tax=Actinomyces lilanjuaniae TaxID=2321394 RepID=UPI0013C4C88A|nr:hypothetical protein [Actinomyces lilanjuaniae]
MIDPEGVEWVRASVAVGRLPGLSRSTLDSWVRRGRVRRHRVGREAWVAWDDVLSAEAAGFLAARRRCSRRGDAPVVLAGVDTRSRMVQDCRQ